MRKVIFLWIYLRESMHFSYTDVISEGTGLCIFIYICIVNYSMASASSAGHASRLTFHFTEKISTFIFRGTRPIYFSYGLTYTILYKHPVQWQISIKLDLWLKKRLAQWWSLKSLCNKTRYFFSITRLSLMNIMKFSSMYCLYTK